MTQQEKEKRISDLKAEIARLECTKPTVEFIPFEEINWELVYEVVCQHYIEPFFIGEDGDTSCASMFIMVEVYVQLLDRYTL